MLPLQYKILLKFIETWENTHTVLCLTVIKLHRTWWLAGRPKQASTSSQQAYWKKVGDKN